MLNRARRKAISTKFNLIGLRSRANKSIELSRGVVTALAYGESKGSVGVDQVKMVFLMTCD